MVLNGGSNRPNGGTSWHSAWWVDINHFVHVARGEHFSSLQFHCEVPTLSVSCVGSFTFCHGSFRLMCSPDEDLSLRKFLASLQPRCRNSRCRAARVCHERGAGLSPCARNTIREAISRDTSSSQHAGHAVRRNRTRSAAGSFSGHRQRSRRICHQKCGCRVSPTTSGSSRSTRDRAAWRSAAQ